MAKLPHLYCIKVLGDTEAGGSSAASPATRPDVGTGDRDESYQSIAVTTVDVFWWITPFCEPRTVASVTLV